VTLPEKDSLRAAREILQRQLDDLTASVRAIDRLLTPDQAEPRKHTMSEAGREAIVKAQKRRWAEAHANGRKTLAKEKP